MTTHQFRTVALLAYTLAIWAACCVYAPPESCRDRCAPLDPLPPFDECHCATWVADGGARD